MVDLLVAHEDEDVRVLAGGQSLVPLMNFRLAQPGYLIDLRRVQGLASIAMDDGVLVLGAMVRQSEAEESAEVALAAPMLAEALGHVAHPPIRNSGTIGGSIAHADPAAELPAVALALEADMVVAGPAEQRTVPAAQFFVGPFETAMRPNEVLIEVRFPRRVGGQAFVEFARTHGSFALVGVGTSVEMQGHTVARASIALSGVGPTPARATAAEQVLVGAEPDDRTIRAAADAAAAQFTPSGDIHGSPETRTALIRSFVRRGLELALSRARDER